MTCEQDKRMPDNDYFFATFCNYFDCVLAVNLDTYEYDIISRGDCCEKMGIVVPQSGSVMNFLRLYVSAGIIHPDDLKKYLACADPENVKAAFLSGQKSLAISFREKKDELSYDWLTFRAIRNTKLPQDNPWVIYSWQPTTLAGRVMNDILKMMGGVFYRIIRINLTKDSFEVIKTSNYQPLHDYGGTVKFTGLVNYLFTSGTMKSEDAINLRSTLNIDNLRQRFRSGESRITFRFRRLVGQVYRWTVGVCIPAMDYTDDNQTVMFYSRDVNDEFITELEYRRKLEQMSFTDALTGLWNRYYYNSHFIVKPDNENWRCVGMLYADLNQLKTVNDTQGHAAGDKYIISFSQMLKMEFKTYECFRLSGDEFFVVAVDVSEDEFFRDCRAFEEKMHAMECPIASVGYSWQENPQNFDDIMRDAERNMYKDKKRFYEITGLDRRGQ